MPQVCCSDVVVLNKCDLVAGGTGSGLGAMSDLEDALSDMAPGVRVVRARYGEVRRACVYACGDTEAREGADTVRAHCVCACVHVCVCVSCQVGLSVRDAQVCCCNSSLRAHMRLPCPIATHCPLATHGEPRRTKPNVRLGASRPL